MEDALELLTLRLADYIIYVVEDFTSVVQRQVHRLARRITQRARGFTELIVVHNWRHTTDVRALKQIWIAQVIASYTDGESLKGVVPHCASCHAAESSQHSAAAGHAADGSSGGAPAHGGTATCNTHTSSQTRTVEWFKTASGVRHLALAQQLCEFGEEHNAATISLLQQWLQSAYVPGAMLRPPLLTQLALDCEATLVEKAKRPMQLRVERTTNAAARRLRAIPARSYMDVHDAPRRLAAATRRACLAQQDNSHHASPTLDAAPTQDWTTRTGASETDPATGGSPSTVLVSQRSAVAACLSLSDMLGLPSDFLTPHDELATLHLSPEGGWLPHVDLCEGTEAFILLVDLPGLRPEQVKLSRSGSLTKVAGTRAPPHGDGIEEVCGERPFGSFALSVRVPDRYHKRWREGKLVDGVLRLSYAADTDDGGCG